VRGAVIDQHGQLRVWDSFRFGADHKNALLGKAGASSKECVCIVDQLT